ncbi:9895_t:CDS:2 [Paraglomus occultum]|uniref:9895_t:CDS:1 n=1 Tax=Paraglomus occultum TaxID=144539 RepID=A0A9N9CUV2_9GLOM|nr:9895_t:CDS:2 [Paraglomus occultum]
MLSADALTFPNFFSSFGLPDVLALLIIVSVLYTIKFYVSYFNRDNALPGPLPLPIVGNLLQFAMYGDMVLWVDVLHKKYGDLWELYMGSERHIWVSRADLVDKLFSTSTKSNFKYRTKGNRALAEIKLLDHGIGMNRDLNLWAFNRKMMKLVMTSKEFNEYVLKIVPKMVNEMETYWTKLGYIEDARQNDLNDNVNTNATVGDVKIINLPDWFFALTLDDILHISTNKHGCALASLLLSHSPNSEIPYSPETMNYAKEFRDSWATFMESISTAIFMPDLVRLGTPIGLMKRRKYLKNSHWLNNNLLSMIREKRAEIENEVNDDSSKTNYDILRLLLVANTPRGHVVKRGSDETDKPMSDDEVRGLLLEILVASVESSASLMCFVIYLVRHNPEVKKKIREEVDPLFKDNPNGILQLDDVNKKLDYLEAVIKETTRIYPSGPINQRLSSQDDEIGGYKWKAGTQFMIDVVGIHNHRAHWSNPEEFKPERFLSQSKDIVPNSIQTFGGGLRICPGKQYGMLFTKIVLASLYNRYDIELANENEKPVAVYRIALHCHRLRVKLKKRSVI